MAEVKASKMGMIKTFVAFGMYALFFLCTCIGVVGFLGEGYGMGDAFDVFDNIEGFLVDKLFKAFEVIFKGGDLSGEIAWAIFQLMAIVTFFIVLIKFILACITFIKGASAKEWDETAEKLTKKYAGLFATVFAYIVLANFWVGEGIELSAGGVIFALLAVAWYVGMPVLEHFLKGGKADLGFILDVVYSAVKAIAIILALNFILGKALIFELVTELISGIFGGLFGGGKIGDVLRNELAMNIGVILMLVAFSNFQKAMKSGMAEQDEKAKSKTFGAVICAVIAVVADLICHLFVIKAKMKFGDWFDLNGSYYILALVFLVVAYAAYYFPKLAATIKAKNGYVAPVAEEVAVAEDAPVEEVPAEEVPAEEPKAE